MLQLNQNSAKTIRQFKAVTPGMILHCTYKLNTKKTEDEQSSRILSFTGPVIQKTNNSIYIRDNRTGRVESISLSSCICGYGKFELKNT